jgi:LysR family nitrogen assimilation transcriptional regulator
VFFEYQIIGYIQINDMNLQQLESFVAVAEQASFTRAAQVLGLAQPALSRHIRSLEVELRQTLLTRNGRGAVTTDAGKLLLEHARGILHQVARAHEDLDQLRGGMSGRVALGLPPSVARVLTVPLTRAFRAELPHAQLSIREGLSADLADSLLNGRLDIAVLYNAQATDGLQRQALIDEELVLVQARPPGLAEEPPPPPMAPPPPPPLRTSASASCVTCRVGGRPWNAIALAPSCSSSLYRSTPSGSAAN